MDIPLSPVRENVENPECPTTEVPYEPTVSTNLRRRMNPMKNCLIACCMCTCVPIIISIGTLMIQTGWNLITSSQFDVICRFNNQENYHYMTGDTVLITINTLRRGRPILNLKDIRVNLIGEFVYYTTEINDGSETIETHKLIFLDKKLNSQSINSSKKIHVPVRSHRRLFSVYLDDGLPPSINSTDSTLPHILYTIKIEVIPSEWYYASIKKEFPIFVQRQLWRPPYIKKVIEQNKDSRDVQIRVTMDENVVIAGDMLEFNIELHNPNQLEINSIWASFDQLWNIGLNNSGHINIGHSQLESFQSFRNKTFFNNFNLNVPETSPSTFSFRHSSSMEKSFQLHYQLIIEIRINDGFSEKRLDVKLSPIVINLNHN